MDLRQLRAFVAIARQRNFTRAAEQLHIAQPAVSMTIRKLEEELELSLFNRQDKRVSLTAEGEAFLRHAEKILDGCETAESEMADLRGLSRGEVSIGIPPMMSTYYFPRVIREFCERYPGLRVSVHGAGTTRIERMIARGEIDMGVIAAENVAGGLASRLVLREEVVIAVPAGHPLAGRDGVSMDEFLRQPLILFQEGYQMRELTDEAIRNSGREPRVVFETNLFSLARSVIKEGLGISTFLRMVLAEDAQLAAVSFDPPLYLDLHLAWKADGYLSRANRAFLDFLLERVATRQQ